MWSKLLLGINPDLSTYREYKHLMHASDWLPTLVIAAGGTTEGSLPLDGYNQWPSLLAATGKGAMPEPPRTEVFYGIR